MEYEPTTCGNCWKTITWDGDDFHFEIYNRKNINVPNPEAVTVCRSCWENAGYREEYNRQQEEIDWQTY